MLSIHDRERRRGPLGEDAERTLRLAFVDGVGTTLDRASGILRGLRERHHWLSCDCAGSPAPLMSPRRLPTGLVVLVRHGRVPHADSCPFHRLRSVSDFTDSAAGPSPAAGAESVQRHLPDDGLLLVEVMVRSGLERIRASDLQWYGRGRQARAVHRDVQDHYAQLDAADDLPVAGDILFGEVHCAHPKGFAWLHPQIGRLSWPDGVAAGGFVLGVVSEIAGRTLSFGRGTGEADQLELEAVPACFGSTPALALARLAAAGDGLTATSAFSYGVFSRGLLLPVESAGERQAAGFLLEQMRYWHEHDIADVTLARPLTLSVAGVRPTFMLEYSGHRVLVELAPSASDAAAAETAARHLTTLEAAGEAVLPLPLPLPDGEDLFALRRRVSGFVTQALVGSGD